MQEMHEPLLEVRGLTMKFGALCANQDISFDVFPGEIIGLIGPNGAGKTTCFNCVTGLLHPTQGSVRFDGTDITRWAPYDIARLGLVRTFQIVHTFCDMTVTENVVTSAFLRTRSAKEAFAKADKAIELTGLGSLRDRLALGLTIADRKRLEIARVFATEPRLIMVDEVSLGLMPTMVDRVLQVLHEIRDRGVTVLMVGQKVEKALAMVDRAYMPQTGKIAMSGAGRELLESPDIRRAYLGL